MYSVGVKSLKNQLSHYIKLAARGETILVTDRNRVVAELRAPDAARSLDRTDACLSELIRNGYLRPALQRGRPERQPGTAKLADLLDELAADRAER